MTSPLLFSRVLFALCPTGRYCREDRCQSYFDFELIPSMRAPLEECEGAAGVTKAGGFSNIIDAPAENLSDEQFFERVAQFRPDLIVLAVTFGSLEDDLKWATHLKHAFPKVTIAVRGAPCYVWARDILTRSSAVDLCVRGDYEIAFENIVRFGSITPGVIARLSNGEITESPLPPPADLDALPFQDRRGIDQSRYTVRGSHRPQATIHVQRGCPFPCTFCLVHSVSGNRARHRSPASIASEMQMLRRSGINDFYLRAETFSLDKRWAIAVCEAIASTCPGARWVTATRVECVDDEVIAAMSAAGCYGISFGVDVASEEIGKRVKKPPQRERASEAMRLCDKYGIISLAYIMIGFIWDTPETIKEAGKFIAAIRPDLLTVHFAHPYPGTPYYQAVIDSGRPVVSLKAQATPALDLEGLSAGAIRSYARSMLLRHYLRPSVLFSLARKTIRHKWSPRIAAMRSPTAGDHFGSTPTQSSAQSTEEGSSSSATIPQ